MKRFFLVILAVFLMTGSAFAVPFSMDSYTVDLRDSDPGLVLYSNNISPQNRTFDLEVGNSISFNLFTVGTNEGTVNWFEDTVAYPISVAFTFSAPSVEASATGDSDGYWRFIRDDYGTVEWNTDANFYFGTSGLFSISLSDVSFGTPGSATVAATLSYISADPSYPAPVPEPATMILMGLGLVGLAGASRKKILKR